MSQDNKPTISSDKETFFYPGYKDHPPFPAAKRVQLLTVGGVALIGQYAKNCGFIAWAPLADRDKEIERELGYRK